LRTLIVDDEPIARQVLREELDLIEGIEVIGEADNGVTALKRISADHPDLVLLDLQMPGMDGLTVLKNLDRGTPLPAVIIVTAYDVYALQAFEAGAIDYLLKPVGGERLARAVQRARRLTHTEAAENIAQLQEIAQTGVTRNERRIVGKIADEYCLLRAEEICAFQAEGYLVWIITSGKKYIATQTLSALEQRLKTGTFRRIHRNALVNIDQIRKIRVLSSQRWLITTAGGHEFIASKRRVGSIRQLLNK
jgi:DNA-binding LytR/AlgR family response regulator